jgi:hypothetical protein
LSIKNEPVAFVFRVSRIKAYSVERIDELSSVNHFCVKQEVMSKNMQGVEQEKREELKIASDLGLASIALQVFILQP